MQFPQEKNSHISMVILVIALLALGSLFAIYYSETSSQIVSSNNQLASLERQLARFQLQNGTSLGAGSQNYTLSDLNPVAIYNFANSSVVTIEGQRPTVNGTEFVLGSGFVVETSSYYVVTNDHVVDGNANNTVTFGDGDAYPAIVVGSDAYADLAVVSVPSAPRSEFHPLIVANSSSLKVGQPVLAIGNPFGLSGSMSFGIISQLGRTITESASGLYPIADVIQISVPINPGNSGGPLLNANGQVVGITTAIIESSQGVGFAIPSETILRELPSLIMTGQYNLHSYIGISSVDMSYDLAQAMNVNITYGVLIEQVGSNSPAMTAGIQGGTQQGTVDGQQVILGGDIIVSINGTRIVNSDALSTYLETNTLPGQVLVLGIIRSGTLMHVDLTLGSRPPP
jgi:S1-C subfamily serine protease